MLLPLEDVVGHKICQNGLLFCETSTLTDSDMYRWSHLGSRNSHLGPKKVVLILNREVVLLQRYPLVRNKKEKFGTGKNRSH